MFIARREFGGEMLVADCRESGAVRCEWPIFRGARVSEIEA